MANELEIRRLSAALKDLAESHAREPVAVMVETGEDEAIMVGTRSAYLRFAAEILDVLSDGVARNANFGSGPLPCFPFGATLNHGAHVVMRTLCVVGTDEDCRRTVKALNKR